MIIPKFSLYIRILIIKVYAPRRKLQPLQIYSSSTTTSMVIVSERVVVSGRSSLRCVGGKRVVAYVDATKLGGVGGRKQTPTRLRRWAENEEATAPHAARLQLAKIYTKQTDLGAGRESRYHRAFGRLLSKVVVVVVVAEPRTEDTDTAGWLAKAAYKYQPKASSAPPQPKASFASSSITSSPPPPAQSARSLFHSILPRARPPIRSSCAIISTTCWHQRSASLAPSLVVLVNDLDHRFHGRQTCRDDTW